MILYLFTFKDQCYHFLLNLLSFGFLFSKVNKNKAFPGGFVENGHLFII